MGPVNRLASAVVLALSVAMVGCGPEERPVGPDWGDGGRIDLANGVDQLELSPDGRRLALLEYGEDGFYPVLLVEGRTTRPLTPDGVHVHAFAWLTDTELLVAHERGDLDRLTVFDTEGERVRDIELERPLRVTGGMAVSPDRTTLALGAVPPGDQAFEGDPQILTFDLATGRLLGEWQDPTRERRDPTFVDEERLVFVDQDLGIDPLAEGPLQVLYLLDLSTGTLRLAHGPNLSPGMSVLHPDGGVLVVNSFEVGLGDRAITGVDLWALPLDGGPSFMVKDLHDGQIGTAFAIEADGDHLIWVDVGRFGIDLVREELPDLADLRGGAVAD
jgi:hypothetical protein